MSYFEGYYIKCSGKQETIAIIFGRAVHKKKFSFIQIITKDSSHYQEFDYKDFFTDSSKFEMRIGLNYLTEKGLILNINTEALKSIGEVKFGEFDKIKSDAMGPFRFLPFLECKHTVISMQHTIMGKITINDQIYNFDGDFGYIEGDRGRSFPKKYFWTQCNNFETKSPISIFASCAIIPYLGIKFNGTVCIIHFDGQEFRLATYLGARVMQFDSSKLIIHQGKRKHKQCLEIEVLDSKNSRPLMAPVKGKMSRIIEESVERTVRYKFIRNSQIIFDLTSNRAAHEYSEY